MSRKYIISNVQNKLTGVLIDENKESRIEIYGASLPYSVDEIYVGRVKDVVNNINAVFIDIRPETTVFMAMDDKIKPIFLNRKNNDRLCQGDLVLVQVKKEPVKTKDGMVSCGINLPGKYVALTREMAGQTGISHKITDRLLTSELKQLVQQYVTDDYGFIIRTEAANADREAIIAEIQKLAAEYNDLIRIASTRTAFSLIKKGETQLIKDIVSLKLNDSDEVVTDIKEIYDELTEKQISNVRFYEDKLLSLSKLYSIETRVDNALKSHIWLKTGGYLIIEHTEAMTVIDVNTGKFDGKVKDKEASFLKINEEAAVEIARQLILRNISGIIIVDFINMKSDESLKILEHLLIKELKKDHITTSFIDFTKLGLAEITRKKIKKPLYEMYKS